MLDYDLPEPEYREDGICFIVTFKRKIEKKYPASAPQVKAALEFCIIHHFWGILFLTNKALNCAFRAAGIFLIVFIRIRLSPFIAC